MTYNEIHTHHTILPPPQPSQVRHVRHVYDAKEKRKKDSVAERGHVTGARSPSGSLVPFWVGAEV